MRGGAAEGCGEAGEAGWNRQVVVRLLNRGVEEEATAWKEK